MHASPPEDAAAHNAGFDPAVHGTSGPVQVSYPRWFNPLHDAFYDALRVAGGVTLNPDSVRLASIWSMRAGLNLLAIDERR